MPTVNNTGVLSEALVGNRMRSVLAGSASTRFIVDGEFISMRNRMADGDAKAPGDEEEAPPNAPVPENVDGVAAVECVPVGRCCACFCDEEDAEERNDLAYAATSVRS